MRIPSKALELIPRFEGWEPEAYWDPYGHVWTIGYGFTKNVHAGQKMTRAEGNKRLEQELKDNYAPSIENLDVPLNKNQFSALLSFVWNLGPGSMKWNVGRSLGERKYEQAANEMLEYDRAGGVVLAGLKARRETERKLFLTPVHHQQNPLNVFYPSERRVVDLYLSYLRHPHLHEKGISKTKNEMTNMRDNIYDAAVYGELKNHHKVKKGWNINNRESRYDLLRKYTV